MCATLYVIDFYLHTDKYDLPILHYFIYYAEDIIMFLYLIHVSCRPLNRQVTESEFFTNLQYWCVEGSVRHQQLTLHRNDTYCAQTSVFQARILTHRLHLFYVIRAIYWPVLMAT